MNFKYYITTIVLILMVLAFSRGFVPHYQDISSFIVSHAHAQAAGDGGDGGDGGSAGAGAGEGSSAGAGAGEGSSAGAGAGEGPSAGSGAGDVGVPGDVSGPNAGEGPVIGCMDTTATNYNPAATSQTGVTCTYPVVVYGCMDTTATNYNPAATSQMGVTCTYPVVVYGCMDKNASNYNPAATSQTGVTCTYPPVVYGCMDTTATNYNPAATSQTGVTCTYPPTPKCTLIALPIAIQTGSSSTLSWTTTNATSFSIDKGIGSVTPVSSGSKDVTPASSITYTGTATGPNGQTTCTATITVSNLPPPPAAPTCTLTASPTAVNQGDHTALTWTTTNGATFTIDHGIGAVTPAVGGTVNSLAIASNTTFTGTVISPTGQSATCTTPVTVTTGGGSGGPSCALSVSPTSITTGSSATLTWSGSGISTVDIDNGIATATTSSGSVKVAPSTAQTYTYTGTFHATDGQTITCAATLTVANAGGGAGGCTSNCGGGGGGGGGGGAAPVITLASLPHVNAQPLAYLYLSQIPYTGLDLGPVGTIIYWLVLILIALGVAYFVLFYAAPFINRSVANFGERVVQVLNTDKLATAGALTQTYAAPAPAPAPVKPEPIMHMQQAEQTHDLPRGYSTYDGFKSFAQKGALSIDDIVKGLTREQDMRTRTASSSASQPAPRNVEPIYEHVEEIVEPASAAHDAVPSPLQMSESGDASGASADVRGFTAALLDGDREAVFAGLRQHIRGGGKAEKLLSATAFLLDDAYRARTDGTPCDADIARLAARFSTPVLEKLVTSLTTAIDSSYSADVTGAKLALTRALAVLGA